MALGDDSKPRIGVPYRTRKEEVTDNGRKIENYLAAVRRAGGAPVAVSLALGAGELEKLAETLDGFVLPGSPADVEPAVYHAPRHPKCAAADADRERTDFALLNHAFTQNKPVLAICYGIQCLNVYLGGTLIQDIPSELRGALEHEWDDDSASATETFHVARFEAGSRVAQLAGGSEARVNSSHHQSIREPGRHLRVTAHAPDGVAEAVEWTGDANWVTGVQWHPERMDEKDALARALFRDLVAAAQKARGGA